MEDNNKALSAAAIAITAAAAVTAAAAAATGIVLSNLSKLLITFEKDGDEPVDFEEDNGELEIDVEGEEEQV